MIEASYSTVCPYCKRDGELEIAGGLFITEGMRLTKDGFAFADAKRCDTEEEWVVCGACGERFSLAEVTL